MSFLLPSLPTAFWRSLLSTLLVLIAGTLLLPGCSSEDGKPTSAPDRPSSTAASPPSAEKPSRLPPNSPVHALLVDRAGHLLAGTDQGLFRWTSTEEGWHQLMVKGSAARAQKYNLIKHLAEGPEGTLFAGHHGLYRSLDGGETWESLRDRVHRPGGGRSDVAVLMATDTAIFAGFLEGGLLRSTNRGGVWDRVLGTSELAARALTEGPDDTLYAILSDKYGEQGTLHRSTDGGDTWTSLPDPPIPFLSMVAAADGVLFGVGFGEGGAGLYAYRSDDEGQTWRSVSALERVPALDRDRAGRVIGLGMEDVLLREADAWSPLPISGTRFRAFAEDSTGTRYLGTDRGVLRAATPDAEWTSFNHGHLQSE